uniref:O-antigen ligase domain-containing protein n=1 Tax=Oscillatoriales cyanobacterium SpSt-418 TaxID=2282169 RepID=A0A7C3KEI1_9CYAN
MTARIFSLRKNPLSLEPQIAWMAILGFILPVALCLLVRFSSILQIFFPAGAFAVGAFLYLRYPILYLGFNWWIWFLSPFIARLVEYQNGIINPGMRFIILAPYLVTMLTAVTFFKHLPTLHRRGGIPFILAFVSIAYALLIGLAKGNAITDVVQGFLSWLPGVFMGVHLMVNWRSYPQLQSNTQRVFLWGILIMGIYGIYQYLVAPEWDSFWLRNADDLQLCCGWPEPRQIRVWSTLNFPFTFGYAMMACLLLSIGSRGPLIVPSVVVGFLSFLLSQVRGAWIGWAFGLFSFWVTLKPSLKVRVMMMFLIITVFLVPIVISTPLAEPVISRLQSFSDTKGDTSANERQEIYAQVLDSVLPELFGRGMGGKGIVDAGVLDVLATLGWLGLLPYLCGIVLIFFTLYGYRETRFDPFMNAARAILPSILITLPFNNALVLLPGILFWGFAGITIAAHKYYTYQRQLVEQQIPTDIQQGNFSK